MPNLFFNNWMLLGGLLALAIPVIIHLLLKRRQQRLRFSTLRFFREQDESAKRRRRLRNLVLLGLRLLLVMLLVLAFARPFLMGSQAHDRAERRHVVLVIDCSASMQTGNRWQRAMEFAAAQLAELTDDDRAALVTCGDTAKVVSGWAPTSKVKPLLDDLQPGPGRSRLAEGLTEASGLAAGREGGTHAAIVLVSDLQREACEGMNRVTITPETELRIESISEPDVANVSLGELGPAGPGSFQVRLRNLGSSGRRNVKVNLTLHGGDALTSVNILPAGTETNVVMGPLSLAPGWHEMTAQIEGADALAADNVRYLALKVPPPQVVWCIEPRPTAGEFEQATFFVRSALAPKADAAPFYLAEPVLLGELFSRLQRETPDLIVVPALRGVPPELPALLGRYVENGGGLILFVGDEVRGDRYNLEWRGLLPATLLRVEGDPERPETFFQLGVDQPDDVLFAPFSAPDSGDISRPAFPHRFELAPAGDAKVRAVFGDGKPFVIVRETGRGRVVLVNTSSDATWSDWPKRRTFVPWVHGLAGVATGQTPWLGVAEGPTHRWGDDLGFDAGNTRAGQLVSVRVRDGALEVAADAAGKVTIQPDRYGVFSLLDEAGKVRVQAAVNFPLEEANLDFASTAEIQRQVQRQSTSRQGALASLANVGQKELWQIILGTGLVLLIAESLLSNRTWA